MTPALAKQPASCFDLDVANEHKHAPLSVCVENALKDYLSN